MDRCFRGTRCLLATTCIAFFLASPPGLFAQQPKAKQGNSPKGSSPDGVLVDVTGIGATPDEALKDALRRAVSQVVGELVDAETLVKDDKLISDSVLTYSKGFVSEYTERKPYIDGGLIFQPILARVKQRDLASSLKKNGVTTHVFDGRKLFAQVTTQMREAKEGSVVIQRLLKDYPANVLNVTVTSEPSLLKKYEADVTLGYELTISVDRAKYKDFLRWTLPTLNLLAYRKGKFTTATKMTPSSTAPFFYKNFLLDDEMPSVATLKRSPGIMRITLPSGPEPWWAKSFDPDNYMVVVVDTLEAGEAQTTWAWYHVPVSKLAAKRLEITVSFVGANKEIVKQQGLLMGPNVPGYNCVGRTVYHKNGEVVAVPQIIVSPYFLAGSHFSSRILVDRSFTVSLDDLKSIRTIRTAVWDQERSQGEKYLNPIDASTEVTKKQPQIMRKEPRLEVTEIAPTEKNRITLLVKLRPLGSHFYRGNDGIKKLERLLVKYEIPYTVSEQSAGIVNGRHFSRCRFNVNYVWYERTVLTRQEADVLEAELADIFTVKRCFD